MHAVRQGSALFCFSLILEVETAKCCAGIWTSIEQCVLTRLD